MRILPAIDLLGGKAVRLHQGRYEEATVYDDDPVGAWVDRHLAAGDGDRTVAP